MIFDVPDARLEFLSPDQLQARLVAFQHGQMNAGQRRRLGAVPGGGRRPLPSVATRAPGAPAAADVGGESLASPSPDDAASSRETPPSGAASAFQARAASSGGSCVDTQPDLSAAQQDGEALGDWDHLLGAVLTTDETDAEFLPPSGLDAVGVADTFLDRYSGHWPSSIAALLEGRPATLTPDPATHFWVSVAVNLQRRLATRLHETIQDGLVADRTRNVAFQTVLETLGRLSRHPLDLEL